MRGTPAWLGFNIELKFPTDAEIAAMTTRWYTRNYFIDAILKVPSRPCMSTVFVCSCTAALHDYISRAAGASQPTADVAVGAFPKHLAQRSGFRIERHAGMHALTCAQPSALAESCERKECTALQVVFEEAGQRKIIFSTFDPDCATLARLKQPRYPVFFLTCAGEKVT